MGRKLLVTGAKGFLGSNVTNHFKNLGYETYGIGHGELSVEESKKIGLDYWKEDDISIRTILEFKQEFDVIVHCGGSGSVGFSVQEPYLDFKKTVDSTAAVLEYMRMHAPNAKLVYPSSPAVHGVHDNTPIRITDPMHPASPYGLHKKMAEELCLQYSKEYKIDISIIRFFSIYGEGLKKQLLWDACNKIVSVEGSAEFWGTGDETRDFIHIDDAASLIYTVATNSSPAILNGGSGVGYTVSDVLHMLRDYLRLDIKIVFNGYAKAGDPKYYTADISNIKFPNWSIAIPLADGLKRYADWFLNDKK